VVKIVLENSKGLAWVGRVMEPVSETGDVEPVPRRRVPTNPLLTRPTVPIGLGASTPSRPS
jgi:hypothetical protein